MKKILISFLIAFQAFAGIIVNPGGGGASLPDQTGNSGKFLTTNGSAASWAAIDISTASVTGVLGPANGGTGVANNAAETITLSGDDPITFTTTDTTGVTLPTSGTLATTAQLTFINDPGTVTDTAILTWSGTTGSAVTTNATHTIASTGAHTQTNSTGQYWVATGAAPAVNTGAVDLATTVGTGAGEYYGIYNTLTVPNNTTPTASIPFYATLSGAGANYNGAVYGMFINNDADVRGADFSIGEQAGGIFHNTRTYNSVSYVAGFTHQSAGGAKNIGVHVLTNGSSASGVQVGVAAKMASAGTGAASVGVWGVLDNDARGATLINSVPSVSAAGLFDNGDFASAILVAQDNGTTVVDIPNGGGINLYTLANPSSTANQVTIGANDDAAAKRVLSIATEETVAADVALSSTHSIRIIWNGTEYKIPLATP